MVFGVEVEVLEGGLLLVVSEGGVWVSGVLLSVSVVSVSGVVWVSGVLWVSEEELSEELWVPWDLEARVRGVRARRVVRVRVVRRMVIGVITRFRGVLGVW